MTAPRDNPPPPSTRSSSSWDGVQLLEAVSAGAACLETHRDHVNALNVFPVPDGDTGTNMVLTVTAGLDEARSLPERDASHAGQVAACLAHGALLGSRGNSGVILSQILAGFAREIASLQVISGPDIVRAVRGAQAAAYLAVQKPVEGTMLTVIRVAAEWAESAGDDAVMTAVLTAAQSGAAFALARTPDLLDLLRQANVVDAGGQGIVYLLDGMSRYARGESVTATVETEHEPHLGAQMYFLDQFDELHGDDAFGYCTNFLVLGDNIDVEAARHRLTAMGTSAVIVGDTTALKVHIHTPEPGKILDYAVSLGDLDQIKIDNMQLQTRRLSAERAAAQKATPSPDLDAPPHALIAVAAGDGLADALRSMGATDVIRGGLSENPSVEELLRAIDRSAAPEAVVLPNNPNILLAAAQLPSLSTKPVHVVPSRSVPQGIAALEGYNPDDDLDVNVSRMTAALAGVRTIELTRAVRDAEINNVSVRSGEVIALLDEDLIASGPDDLAAVIPALRLADAEDAELATVFSGADVTAEAAGFFAAQIQDLFPNLEIQIVRGGQPHYRYILGVQ